MTGIVETHLHCFRRLQRFAIGCRLEQLEGRLSLCHGVQRGGDAALAPATPTPVAQLPLGFLFLNVRAVRQQHLEQVDGRRGCVDRPAVAENRQPWQQPGMVDVGVGEQDEIDFPHVEAEVQRPQVLRARFRPTLEHAAVDQKAGVPRFHQSAGTGDLARCTEKTHTHDRIPFVSDRR